MISNNMECQTMVYVSYLILHVKRVMTTINFRRKAKSGKRLKIIAVASCARSLFVPVPTTILNQVSTSLHKQYAI